MFRRKWLLLAGLALVLIPVAVVGWWLLSPLFISKTVDEEFPFAVNALVPPGMTRAEVEDIMAGMAKVDSEIDEAMTESAMMEAAPNAVAGREQTAAQSRRMAVQVKAGDFRDADRLHRGSGRAIIYRGPDGSYLLRFEDFRVTNGPDLHVLLSPHPGPKNRDEVNTSGYIDLGSLKGNIGNQNYPVPQHVDVTNQRSVVIYCKPFHVIFSVASLQVLE